MLAGIYKIVNNKNGKFYIGSSKNLKLRKAFFCLKAKRALQLLLAECLEQIRGRIVFF